MPCGPAVRHQQRYPSGAAFMTFSEPILPVAPGRFSTTTVCFSRSLSSCARIRATTSVEPPGEEADHDEDRAFGIGRGRSRNRPEDGHGRWPNLSRYSSCFSSPYCGRYSLPSACFVCLPRTPRQTRDRKMRLDCRREFAVSTARPARLRTSQIELAVGNNPRPKRGGEIRSHNMRSGAAAPDRAQRGRMSSKPGSALRRTESRELHETAASGATHDRAATLEVASCRRSTCFQTTQMPETVIDREFCQCRQQFCREPARRKQFDMPGQIRDPLCCSADARDRALKHFRVRLLRQRNTDSRAACALRGMAASSPSVTVVSSISTTARPFFAPSDYAASSVASVVGAVNAGWMMTMRLTPTRSANG